MKKWIVLFFLLLVALLVALPFCSYGNREEIYNYNIIYVVEEGDTLSLIARELGTTIKSIVQLNRIENPDLIYVGQELKINAYSHLKEVKVSWYGPGFEGNNMANGHIFNITDETIVAHKYLPFGTRVKLTYGDKSIIVVIQDRGPFNQVGDKIYFEERRDFDLSQAAAELLEIKNLGVARCKIEILSRGG